MCYIMLVPVAHADLGIYILNMDNWSVSDQEEKFCDYNLRFCQLLSTSAWYINVEDEKRTVESTHALIFSKPTIQVLQCTFQNSITI